LSYERKSGKNSASKININPDSTKNDGNSADKERASQKGTPSKLKSIDEDSLKDAKKLDSKNDYMKEKKFKFLFFTRIPK